MASAVRPPTLIIPETVRAGTHRLNLYVFNRVPDRVAQALAIAAPTDTDDPGNPLSYRKHLRLERGSTYACIERNAPIPAEEIRRIHRLLRRGLRTEVQILGAEEAALEGVEEATVSA